MDVPSPVVIAPSRMTARTQAEPALTVGNVPTDLIEFDHHATLIMWPAASQMLIRYVHQTTGSALASVPV